MANSLCFTFASIISSQSPIKPGILICSEPTKIHGIKPSVVKNAKFRIVETKATESNSNQGKTKINSIVCADCDGNGALQCSQCKGDGVNSVDHFNGQFKAGGLCWLCRGKREILCGNCNGAGFLGGFMSSFDE